MYSRRLVKLRLVRGQVFTPELMVRLPGDETLLGVEPRMSSGDSLLMQPTGRGGMLAAREGRTVIEAEGAGRTFRWEVTIESPGIRVDLPSAVLPVGEPMRPAALHVDLDGSILGEATGVTWESLDPSVLEVRDGLLIGRSIGVATVVARGGGVEDRARVNVLGDLIVAVRSGRETTLRTLTLDDGEVHELPAGSPRGTEPAVAPTGEWVAFVVPGLLSSRVHLMRPDGSEVRRAAPDVPGILGLRTGWYREHRPAWSPDGQTLYFLSNAGGGYGVWALEIGSGEMRRLGSPSHHVRAFSIDPVSGDLVLERTRGSEASDLFTIRSDGTGLTRIFDGGDTAWYPYLYQDPVAFGEGNTLVARRSNAFHPALGEDVVLLRPMSANPAGRVAALVPAEPESWIRHAVSPSGGYVAFIRGRRGGSGAARIHLYGMDREVVRPVELEGGFQAEALAWLAERSRMLQGVVR
jgi:hypothetical protein